MNPTPPFGTRDLSEGHSGPFCKLMVDARLRQALGLRLGPKAQSVHRRTKRTTLPRGLYLIDWLPTRSKLSLLFPLCPRPRELAPDQHTSPAVTCAWVVAGRACHARSPEPCARSGGFSPRAVVVWPKKRFVPKLQLCSQPLPIPPLSVSSGISSLPFLLGC
jgi:hypothetical protein